MTVDFPFQLTFSLGNRVWNDANDNSMIDAIETGIAGAVAELLTSGGSSRFCCGVDNNDNDIDTANNADDHGHAYYNRATGNANDHVSARRNHDHLPRHHEHVNLRSLHHNVFHHNVFHHDVFHHNVFHHNGQTDNEFDTRNDDHRIGSAQRVCIGHVDGAAGARHHPRTGTKYVPCGRNPNGDRNVFVAITGSSTCRGKWNTGIAWSRVYRWPRTQPYCNGDDLCGLGHLYARSQSLAAWSGWGLAHEVALLRHVLPRGHPYLQTSRCLQVRSRSTLGNERWAMNVGERALAAEQQSEIFDGRHTRATNMFHVNKVAVGDWNADEQFV